MKNKLKKLFSLFKEAPEIDFRQVTPHYDAAALDSLQKINKQYSADNNEFVTRLKNLEKEAAEKGNPFSESSEVLVSKISTKTDPKLQENIPGYIPSEIATPFAGFYRNVNTYTTPNFIDKIADPFLTLLTMFLSHDIQIQVREMYG